MKYYDIGSIIVNGKERKNIVESDNPVKHGIEIDAGEATVLLERYAIEDRIDELKKKLSATDYISCKIAEGAATVEEYAEIIEQRQRWRETINELEEDN